MMIYGFDDDDTNNNIEEECLLIVVHFLPYNIDMTLRGGSKF